MDFYFSVVVDETELPELVHEKAHPRACRADHFGQRLLTDIRLDRGRITNLVEAREIITQFHLMIRRRLETGLTLWIERARPSLIASFANEPRLDGLRSEPA
jgi:hypothetical protein